MNELTLYKIVLLGVGIISFLIAWGHFLIKENNLKLWERLTRNRNLALPLVFCALLWCIPHAKAVAWDWLAPWMFGLVILFTILSYVYMEYLPARALGGIFILYGCYVAQESYAWHTPGAGWLMILTWTIAIVGMFIAAKPHLLRDYFRKVVSEDRYRFIGAAFFCVYGIWSLALGIIHLVKGAVA